MFVKNPLQSRGLILIVDFTFIWKFLVFFSVGIYVMFLSETVGVDPGCKDFHAYAHLCRNEIDKKKIILSTL